VPCAAPRTLGRALAAPRLRSAIMRSTGVRVDEIVDGFAIDRAISVGGGRSRPIPSHRESRDLDSWGNWRGRPRGQVSEGERSTPPAHGGAIRGATCCPAPTTMLGQLHAQQGWVQAGPCQPSVGVIGRSVGEAAVALAAVTGCHPGEGGVTAAWRHSSKFADSVNEPARTRPNPRNPPRA
jgi:hypothetical protein